jgi:RND family efflux transporter MFP subunit
METLKTDEMEDMKMEGTEGSPEELPLRMRSSGGDQAPGEAGSFSEPFTEPFAEPEKPGVKIPRIQGPMVAKKRGTGPWIVIALVLIAGYLAYRGFSGRGSTRPLPAGPQQAPSVVLSVVAKVDLATEREYVGRVEPIQSVQIRPQISAQIAQVHFKEGSAVKAGQLLFTLDGSQYQATVDLRKADLARAEAAHDRARKYLSRLKAADRRSVSELDLDVAQSDVLQGKAGVEQAKAALRLAQIDLGRAKITAPIAGRVGGALFTKGNSVTPAGGPLAEIVQTDPIRVAFALSDRDYLDAFDRFGVSGDVYSARVRLANGEEYPLSGVRDFEENVMDGRTGTMTVRLRFKNDRGILIPGAMVRVTTRPARSRVAVVVPQESILADARGDYVYVVDAGNVTHQRRVTLGAEEGMMREVVSGLSEGDFVVVYGLQSIRPEMKVTPIDASTLGGRTGEPSEGKN